MSEPVWTSSPEVGSVCCDACDKLMLQQQGVESEYQLDNNLIIEFDGGYGMFIDPFWDTNPKVNICHECAHDLCDKVPWIKKLLDPNHSHSHSTKHKEELIDAGHIGWDFDNCCDINHREV